MRGRFETKLPPLVAHSSRGRQAVILHPGAFGSIADCRDL